MSEVVTGQPAPVKSNESSIIEKIIRNNCEDTLTTLENDLETRFIVTPLGKILNRRPPVIVERDVVHVVTAVKKDMIPNVFIRRTSKFGTEVIRFAGIGDEQSLVGDTSDATDCKLISDSLMHFSPGVAQISISVLQNNEFVDIGKIEFEVRPLYSGAISLGVVAATLYREDRYYDAVASGGSVSILSRKGAFVKPVYALLFTPFLVSGPRDIKSKKLFVNPIIGLGIGNLGREFLIGVDIDFLNGMLHTSTGVYIGKVDRLHQDFRGDLLTAFSGDTNEIPLETHWRTGPFLGLSLNARIVVNILGMGTKALIGN